MIYANTNSLVLRFEVSPSLLTTYPYILLSVFLTGIIKYKKGTNTLS